MKVELSKVEVQEAIILYLVDKGIGKEGDIMDITVGRNGGAVIEVIENNVDVDVNEVNAEFDEASEQDLLREEVPFGEGN